MKLSVITTLCIALSILITTCSSHQTPVLSSHELVHDLGLSLTKLPRKLRHVEEPIVNGYKSTDFIPDTKQKDAFPGKLYNQGMLDGRKGTRQNWMEANTWQYFTMDYTHVRRRRPIHNRSVPVGP